MTVRDWFSFRPISLNSLLAVGAAARVVGITLLTIYRHIDIAPRAVQAKSPRVRHVYAMCGAEARGEILTQEDGAVSIDFTLDKPVRSGGQASDRTRGAQRPVAGSGIHRRTSVRVKKDKDSKGARAPTPAG
jgi:hypothetical protein